METEWIHTTERFEALADEWEALLADSEDDNPFLSWAWMSQWWRHYGAGRRLFVITVRDGQRLVGIAPLQRPPVRDRWGARTVRFFGTGDVCTEHLGFILRRGAEVDAGQRLLDFLCTTLKNRWDLLELRDMADTSPTLVACQQALTEAGRLYCRWPGWSYNLVDLPDSWEAFQQSGSSKRRQRNRKILREIEKLGVHYAEVTAPDQLPEAWDDLRRLHQLRWTAKGEAGCFASAQLDQFHRSVLPLFLERGELALCFLRTHKEAIAASYCVRRNGCVYSYQAGLHPGWLKHRPGQALHLLELQKAIERGDRCYDLLGGNAEAKARRATRLQPTSKLLLAAPRATARAHFAHRVAAYHLKRHVKRFAPAWLLDFVRPRTQSA